MQTSNTTIENNGGFGPHNPLNIMETKEQIAESILKSLKQDPEAMSVYRKIAEDQGYSSVEELIQSFVDHGEAW